MAVCCSLSCCLAQMLSSCPYAHSYPCLLNTVHGECWWPGGPQCWCRLSRVFGRVRSPSCHGSSDENSRAPEALQHHSRQASRSESLAHRSHQRRSLATVQCIIVYGVATTLSVRASTSLRIVHIVRGVLIHTTLETSAVSQHPQASCAERT